MAPNTSAVTHAVPGVRDKNQKVPSPSVAPNVPGQQGKPKPSVMQPGATTEKQKHVDHPESPSQTPSPDLVPNTSGVTNLTSEAPGKTHKEPAPSTAPNVPEQQGKPLKSGSQESAPRNVSKHEESSHQSNAETSNQPTAAASVMQSGATTEKQQKHVDHAESPSQQSDNSRQPSTKQDKPLQPPPAVAHQDEHSERSPASANQKDKASQPSNASADEGNKGGGDKKKDKGGGEKKSDEKKEKADN